MADRPHIILAEDEAIAAMSLKMNLDRLGFTVSAVATGEQACRLFGERGADLLLMDIQLAGGLDGIETVRRIRRQAAVPAIFMTGYEAVRTDRMLAGLEHAGFLIKPVDFRMLEELVIRVLGP